MRKLYMSTFKTKKERKRSVHSLFIILGKTLCKKDNLTTGI